MAYKAIFAFCLLAVLAQTKFVQCHLGAGLGSVPSRLATSLPNPGTLGCVAANNPRYGAAGFGSGVGYGAGNYGVPFEVQLTHGGGFTVTSTSTTAPSGITITSDNSIQGNVVITGDLPLFGTAALEGNTPSSGVGIANYGCGNGVTAIGSVGVGPGVGAAGAYPSGLPGISGLSALSGSHGHLDGCGCFGHI